MIFYTYIRTERIRIFAIISLILSEFSYGKAQIPHRFLQQALSKSCFHCCLQKQGICTSPQENLLSIKEEMNNFLTRPVRIQAQNYQTRSRDSPPCRHTIVSDKTSYCRISVRHTSHHESASQLIRLCFMSCVVYSVILCLRDPCVKVVRISSVYCYADADVQRHFNH